MKILLNGFGRIGRTVTRILIENRSGVEIYIHNRRHNPELFKYLIEYDSLYGKLTAKKTNFDEHGAKYNNVSLKFVSNISLKEIIERKSVSFDLFLDTSPNTSLSYKELIDRRVVTKVIVSHMLKEADFTFVYGVNEAQYKPKKHSIVSMGICDVVALSPVLHFLHSTYEITAGSILTIHPWLSYQNLLDNTSIGYMDTKDFGLYRSSVDNLIPKSTSAIEANLEILPELKGRIDGFTFRVPTASVTSGNLTLNVRKNINKDELVQSITQFARRNKKIIQLNNQPLVSRDFQKTECSCIIDMRFLKIMPNNMIQLMLWYDNEWGYSYRVFDFIKRHLSI